MITDKPVASAPPRLQRMLIKLQGLQLLDIASSRCTESMADGLSRLPTPHNNAAIDLDVRVDLVYFSSDRLEKVRRDTVHDPVLNQQRDTIMAWLAW